MLRTAFVDPDLKRFAAAANAAGVNGTPAFQGGRTGGRMLTAAIAALALLPTP